MRPWGARSSGKCPCPQQRVGIGWSSRSIPTQNFLLFLFCLNHLYISSTSCFYLKSITINILMNKQGEDFRHFLALDIVLKILFQQWLKLKYFLHGQRCFYPQKVQSNTGGKWFQLSCTTFISYPSKKSLIQAVDLPPFPKWFYIPPKWQIFKWAWESWNCSWADVKVQKLCLCLSLQRQVHIVNNLSTDSGQVTLKNFLVVQRLLSLALLHSYLK